MNSSKKVVIIGQFGVGKTSLTRRFVDNAFSEDYLVTLGVQIKKKVVSNVKDEGVSLILWDLEGTTSIEKTRESYLLGAHAFIYVFDCTRIATYENLQADLNFLRTHNIPIKVLGNKSDIGNTETVITYLESHNIAKEVDFFTSAKTGENVLKTFETLANELT